MKERYWLRINGLAWQEATREQFIKAEGAVGFYPSPGRGDLATAGFMAGGVEGRITYGEITERDYGFDPDFLKAAKSN